MRDLTAEQRRLINDVTEKTARQRKALTQYRADDRSLAFFRMQADHHAREIILRHAVNEPLRVETMGFLETYLKDPDEELDKPVKAFLEAVERATGRELRF